MNYICPKFIFSSNRTKLPIRTLNENGITSICLRNVIGGAFFLINGKILYVIDVILDSYCFNS